MDRTAWKRDGVRTLIEVRSAGLSYAMNPMGAEGLLVL